MKLKEWMRSNKYTCRGLAEKLNTSTRNVEKWSRGERLPRWHEAEKIFTFTETEVTGHDLYAQQIQRNKMRIQRDQV